MQPMRLLFTSIHSYLDPSSGAAVATRELLEVVAARDMDCRVLCPGVLDYERETTLDEVLASLELPRVRFLVELTAGGSAEVFDLAVGGVRVTIFPTPQVRGAVAQSAPKGPCSSTWPSRCSTAFNRTCCSLTEAIRSAPS